MSSARDGGRYLLEGRRRLVLVRGGLDDLPPRERRAASREHRGEAADWDSFCQRIGWNPTAANGSGALLGDDFEDRLLNSIAERCDDDLELDADRAEPNQRTADAHWTSDRRRDAPIAWARAAFIVSLAAAAVVLIVSAAMLSWADHRSATLPASPEKLQPPPPSQADARARAVESVDAPSEEVLDEPRTEEPPSEPSDLDPSKPEPGSRVAIRSVKSHHRAIARAGGRNRSHTREPSREDVQRPAAEPTDLRSADFDPPSHGGTAFKPALAERVAFAPDPAASLGGTWREPTNWRSGEQPREDVGWTLPDAGSRWYGVALPPSREPAGLPPGLGVMAQVDLGRALGI